MKRGGYSCFALAEHIVSGDRERAREQAEYIVRCGGSANLNAVTKQ